MRQALMREMKWRKAVSTLTVVAVVGLIALAAAAAFLLSTRPNGSSSVTDTTPIGFVPASCAFSSVNYPPAALTYPLEIINASAYCAATTEYSGPNTALTTYVDYIITFNTTVRNVSNQPTDVTTFGYSWGYCVPAWCGLNTPTSNVVKTQSSGYCPDVTTSDEQLQPGAEVSLISPTCHITYWYYPVGPGNAAFTMRLGDWAINATLRIT